MRYLWEIFIEKLMKDIHGQMMANRDGKTQKPTENKIVVSLGFGRCTNSFNTYKRL